MSDTEEERTGVIHETTMLFERILESRWSSNILIVVLIILVALPLWGIAVGTMRATAPQDSISSN